ncbi:gfo/Idh/MocA family oxidoreductase [Opitutaceae bacterium TAV4]|nr:gfo/Idh/MocA family oxidoreductase [Opitutaceae bacterium TAV4]RRJ99725.1 gfo/Idh/MocA family oxidoreductase [Opitutaceae bacterium TAV3]
MSVGQPVTFALVGCGAIAPTQAKALLALREDARLPYCCDEVPERAEKFAAEFGLKVISWRDLLADPAIQAVTLCLPSGLHAKLGVEALAAGKHVVVEKPMDVSVAACDMLIAAAEKAGRQFAVISQHRFDPASQLVHSTVARGELGKLIFADARIPWYRTQDYYDSGDWRGTWALDGGGCLMNQGVHTLDLMLWLAGPVESVFAQMRTAAHERIEVEDVVTATLTFKNGAIGTLMASTSTYPGFPARIAITGTEGTAIIEGDELHTLAIKGRDTLTGGHATEHALQVATGGTRSAVHHAKADEKLPPPPVPSAGASTGATPIPVEPADKAWKWGDAHRAQLLDFIRTIRAGGRPLVDGAAGRAAVQLINAVYQSAREGRVVKL